MRISDWSSDVCSSDLVPSKVLWVPATPSYTNLLLSPPGKPKGVMRSSSVLPGVTQVLPPSSERCITCPNHELDRKSVVSGKSVSVRVDRGGRRIINKKLSTSTQKITKRIPILT